MPSLGANPLQNPDPIVHKVSNGHAVHFCESAAEENKNDLKKYLPVSRPSVLQLLTFKGCVNSILSWHTQHSTVCELLHLCKRLTDSLGGAEIFSSVTVVTGPCGILERLF